MEYIYFARPDSSIEGINVHTSRRHAGMLLAKSDDVEADIVIGVPDSSLSAAIGYSEASGLPYEIGLIKNRYVGRTFIQPTQKQRERGVRMKLSAISSIVSGKRVVMVDDRRARYDIPPDCPAVKGCRGNGSACADRLRAFQQSMLLRRRHFDV